MLDNILTQDNFYDQRSAIEVKFISEVSRKIIIKILLKILRFNMVNKQTIMALKIRWENFEINPSP